MCQKCKRTIFLQSDDGKYCVDSTENKVRLKYYDVYDEIPAIEDSHIINYCPICGNKIADIPIEKFTIIEEE
jgi:hypothetical protein